MLHTSLLWFYVAVDDNWNRKTERAMKIVFEIGEEEITATMKTDSAAARDFVNLLPLSLTLTDYSVEKVADLPKALLRKVNLP